ncbi:MAG: M1 family metallopeptidase [Saprospiraceae bacterium]
MYKSLIFPLLMLLASHALSQRDFYNKFNFTKADTLRGMLTPERACYDVTFYDLNVALDINKKFLKGFVEIEFDVVNEFSMMQIDLFRNMTISEITWYGQPLTYQRLFDAVMVYLPEKLEKGTHQSIIVYYEGFPTIATNAPWEGGFVWKQDQKQNPWVAVACEGDGASLWWPCKDHLSDEPDSMAIHVTVPTGLVAVANGNLRKARRVEGGYTEFYWFVSYPINNYNASINIGKYAHFSDWYHSADGDSLALDYYVLEYNLDKAKKHFEQVKPMLACYEKYFGKYPFWNDGYALVETPYLGMEHQSGIAYGNNYNRGYLGGMIPRDMEFDYLIIHESGHEYFGNAISASDHADMWIHESFTTYMESLYVECMMSYADAVRYLESQRPFIRNGEPIVGPRDVNFGDWSGSDHYFKGAWILHTLRNAIGDDAVWFGLLRGFYDKFKYKTCTTEDFVLFTNEFTGKDFTPFFEQYLYYANIPRLEIDLEQMGADLKVIYKWEAEVPTFNMPVKVGNPNNYQTIYPTANGIQETILPNLQKSDFQVATELFYIKRKSL